MSDIMWPFVCVIKMKIFTQIHHLICLFYSPQGFPHNNPFPPQMLHLTNLKSAQNIDKTPEWNSTLDFLKVTLCIAYCKLSLTCSLLVLPTVSAFSKGTHTGTKHNKTVGMRECKRNLHRWSKIKALLPFSLQQITDTGMLLELKKMQFGVLVVPKTSQVLLLFSMALFSILLTSVVSRVMASH